MSAVTIKTLAPEFKVSSLSLDGVIEAWEHDILPIYCLRWHLERMRGNFPITAYGPDTDILFKEFLNMCK